MLAAELARCLAHVVSELVINAAKHAFPRGKAGRIRVVLSRTANHLTYTVLDDGCGADPASRLSSSRGLELTQNAALFLASDESSFVNGSELFADGGSAQI